MHVYSYSIPSIEYFNPQTKKICSGVVAAVSHVDFKLHDSATVSAWRDFRIAYIKRDICLADFHSNLCRLPVGWSIDIPREYNNVDVPFFIESMISSRNEVQKKGWS